MRISTCFGLRARRNPFSFRMTIENLGRCPQIFHMPLSFKSHAEPEIIPPAAALRLEALQEQHEAEEKQLARLEALADLMDTRFNIPVLPMPIGLDTIVGLIPVFGDTISFGVSGVIVGGAHRLKIPKRHLAQMGGNLLIDWIIGLVPIIGDIFDIGWQGNVRNVKIARSVLEARWESEVAEAMNG